MNRLALALGIAAAGVAAVYSGWRLSRWRQAEEEKRLRQIHTLTGTIERFPEFRSEILGLERRIWVYLPPMYEDEDERRFPVLYMHDGQNVFDGATAYLAGKEWEADETAERLIAEGRIEPLIIVAVDNGGAARVEEYTPTVDRRGRGGHLDPHARMLVEEVKPWVDETFRTRPGREDTGIAGSSYGALAALWTGLTYPDVFGKIAALSPSVGRDNRQILGFVASLPEKPDTRIWTDIGTLESPRAVEDARRLRDALLAKGWEEGVDLRYLEAAGEGHNETAWAKRVPAILEFLFPAPKAGPEGIGETDA
jgi:predicted alpha/beta superfamily hydrolase